MVSLFTFLRTPPHTNSAVANVPHASPVQTGSPQTAIALETARNNSETEIFRDQYLQQFALTDPEYASHVRGLSNFTGETLQSLQRSVARRSGGEILGLHLLCGLFFGSTVTLQVTGYCQANGNTSVGTGVMLAHLGIQGSIYLYQTIELRKDQQTLKKYVANRQAILDYLSENPHKINDFLKNIFAKNIEKERAELIRKINDVSQKLSQLVKDQNDPVLMALPSAGMEAILKQNKEKQEAEKRNLTELKAALKPLDRALEKIPLIEKTVADWLEEKATLAQAREIARRAQADTLSGADSALSDSAGESLDELLGTVNDILVEAGATHATKIEMEQLESATPGATGTS